MMICTLEFKVLALQTLDSRFDQQNPHKKNVHAMVHTINPSTVWEIKTGRPQVLREQAA